MVRYIVAYAATAVVFAVMDGVWLSLANSRLYRPEIGPLLADKVRLTPAAAFYLLYVLGVVVFAVLPALRSGNLMTALGYGALLGLVAYGAYDLTNQATMRIWSVKVTTLDLLWGAFATSIAAAAGTWITRMIVKG